MPKNLFGETPYEFNEKEHIHTIEGKPLIGTSTAVGIIAKPLTWWASGKAVETLGWKNPKVVVNGMYRNIPKEDRLKEAGQVLEAIKGMDEHEYLSLLDTAYKAHSKTLGESAKDGVNLHKLLEDYVRDCILKKEVYESDNEKIKDFSIWAVNNVKEFLFSEAHCFSKTLWVGGIVDAMAKMKDGTTAIIDFKSSKDAYFSQFVQIALYDLQIQENGGYSSIGEKLVEPIKSDKYIIIPFGAPTFMVRERYDTEEFRKAAKACIELYKQSNNYQ